MSFSQSAQSIRLDGTTLTASLQNENGDWNDSQLDLSKYLGNTNGQFKWGDEDFQNSAQDIQLINDNNTLQASLQNENGDWNTVTVNLDECITNNNGQLAFQQVL